MELQLKKPIVFFDIESTGLSVVKDRIVEISAVKIFPDGTKEIKTRRVNPGIHISAEATAIHNITDEDVKDAPTFKQIARSLANWMEGCDIAGYNFLKFDIPMLEEEFIRCGVDFDFRKRNLIDVQNIFHKMEQRTLKAAYQFYCNKNLENAHSAEGDTLATFEVLQAQLDRYQDTLKNDMAFLAEFSSKTNSLDYDNKVVLNGNGKAVFNFGKHKGKLVVDVFNSEPSYYDWMMKGEFTENTKKILTDIKTHPDKYS